MFNTRLLASGRFWLAAAVLVAQMPPLSLAQDDDPMTVDATEAVVHEIKHSHDRLEMIVNSSRILTLDQKIPKAVVNNPDLLDVTPLSPSEIQIFAKKAGVTQINVWGEDKKVRSVDVIIFADAQELAMLLKHQFPNATLRVIPLANSVVISGYLDDADQVSRIVQMAEDFHPKVINNINIGGVQQVLLQVKMLEVSRTRLRRVGFDFSRIGIDDFAVSGVSGLIGSTATSTNVLGNIANSGAASAGLVSSTAGTVAFGVMDATRSATFFGVLDLLQQNNLAKLLAEPNLVCVSGRPAFFNSGGEFPIIVPQSLGTVSIQYKKYGTQLDFVPIVLGNGNIRLEVKPRVSEIDPTRTVIIDNNSVPALKTREAETGVEMQPGQTLAIAGLVYNRQEGVKRGIPFLADLPYVGAAFRRVELKDEEVELLIMVTPQLVEPLDPCEVPCGGPGTHSATPNDVQLYLKGHLEVGTDAPLAPGSGAGQYPPACPIPYGTFGADGASGSGADCPVDGLPAGATQGDGTNGGAGERVEEVTPRSEMLPKPSSGETRSRAPRPGSPVAQNQFGRPQLPPSASRGRVTSNAPANRANTRAMEQRLAGKSTGVPAQPVVRVAPEAQSPQSSKPARLDPAPAGNRVSSKPGFIGPTGYDVRD
jgi:pilus assembly protein CpaC